jgi:hypothetical protein
VAMVLPSGETMPKPVTTTLRLDKRGPPEKVCGMFEAGTAIRGGPAGGAAQAWLRRSET